MDLVRWKCSERIGAGRGRWKTAQLRASHWRNRKKKKKTAKENEQSFRDRLDATKCTSLCAMGVPRSERG